MGIHSRLDFQDSSSAPDTVPDLVSPSSSTYSSRLSEDRFSENSAPFSPPMSSHDRSTRSDMSAGKDTEDGSSRRGLPHNPPPRQQLPSLSSIFGPSQHVRPLHSPHLDRPSPLHGANSPLDRPLSASANPERPYSRNSYFPNVSPSVTTQPRSVYDPWVETERPSLPSVVRDLPGPLSPSAREVDQGHYAPRNEMISSARWSQSSMNDSRRPDYVFSSRPSTPSFRLVNERMPLPPLGQNSSRELNPAMKQEGQLAPGASNRSPTVASVTNHEGVPVKDGLGPKIWTGTHFLPRFVRQAEVHGEGLCYFYDDGTHCKTIIDGEPVNAHWGVTKAGKPRKRLAIACLTCREKKIKCDPDYPRCVQCEKFGRVCKFKNAPRGGHNTSPLASPGELDDARQLGAQPRAMDFGRPRDSSTSVSPRTTRLSHPSPEISGLPPKRIKYSYEAYPASANASAMSADSEIKTAGLPWQPRDLPRIHEEYLGRKWQTDPYVSDPQATTTIITSFFNHIKAMALRFLPERIFKDWVQNIHHTHTAKSPEDLMLVYSLLAFGLHVSGGSKRSASEYSQIARFASNEVPPCLQLVQTKLVLSLFYRASARPFDSDDMLSGAISAALYLRLNIELNACDKDTKESVPFDMNDATYAECRRRTVYSCFLWERLNGSDPRRPLVMKADDIFLQLPRREMAFDEGTLASERVPFFDINRDIPAIPEDVGIMGHIVLIAEVFGRIQDWIQREAIRAQPTDADSLKVLERMAARLRQCQDVLPVTYRFSDKNLANASTTGIEGCLIMRHLVNLLARTKFARHVQSTLTRSLFVEERSRKAIALGGDLMFATVALRDQQRSRQNSAAPFVLGPFAIQAAIEAVDLLSANGPISSIANSLNELVVAKDMCDALSLVWDDAKPHKQLFDQRTEKLVLIRERGASAITDPIPGCEVYTAPNSTNLLYRMLDPLQTRLPLEMDAVYSIRGDHY
ncbi:fungal-specific transcription factor [Xylariaceae sp. FL0016]|nr:fungal-specific transcription factor [Xylariaceae sp. FL0016]